MYRAPFIALAALALAACGSPETPAGGESPAPATVETPVPAESTATLDCNPVEQHVLDRIGSGAEEGTGLQMVRGSAYRSPNHEKVWFVAGEFSITGAGNQTGVWVTNSLEPSGGITMAVDGFAQEFTVWPDADTTDAAISAADPGVTAAKDCLAQTS